MPITSQNYGSLPDGSPVQLFRLKNSNGLSAEITNYGGIIVALNVPDKAGNFSDIVLGKEDLQGYLAGHPHFGAITGRVAGRISDACFCLEGKTYQLTANNGPNGLHGGLKGFDKQLWDAKIRTEEGNHKLELSLIDPDGHNGFPGTVHCLVTYALLDDNSLEITYRATTDRTTPLNLTNHSYFNLAGHNSGSALGHTVQIHSDTIAPVDANATLLGKRETVKAGFNDYRNPVKLEELDKLVGHNADVHYFLEGGRTKEPRLAAVLYEPTSARIMEVLTTEPGVQFYASLFLSADRPEKGKNGAIYPANGGLCFETQDYADSVNCPEMGGAILRPDEVFQSTTIYRFRTGS